MAVDIKFLIDGVDRGQPINANEFGFTIAEEASINARIVSFNNELIFIGQAYEYLMDKLDNNGFCNLINVEVQYKCEGQFKQLVKGYFIISECLFLIDKCQVKTKLYDESFSTKINNNKNIPFSMLNALTKNLQPVTPPTIISGEFFNPANGVYDTNDIIGYQIFDVFKHLVSCMSDNLIDFASNLFEFDLTTSGDLYIVTNGEAIRSRLTGEVVVSFEKLFTAMHKKLNLCIVFEKQTNGRPLLRIEDAAYINQQNPSANLYDQPDINLSFDRDRLYSAVDFGSSPMLEAEDCTGGTCTFTQTPFRGFREETFGFTGECNTSKVLDLNSSDIIFDTNVIEDVFRFNAEDRKLDTFIIEANYNTNTNLYRAKKFDPYNLNQSVYNGGFRNINVSSNWIGGYPNSLFSFLNISPNAALSNLSAFGNFPIAGQPFFVTDDGVYTDFESYNGFPVPFSNVQYDVNNNFDNYIYTAPFLGTYTIGSYVVLSNIFATASRYSFISIVHMNSANVVIQTYNGPALQKQNINITITNLVINILMNAGDKIKVNVYGRQALSGPPKNQGVQSQGVEDGILYNTQLIISGLPLLANNPPSELEAVNIEDVRAYLYKFERPLTMNEIEAILNNTSRPISFGRYDDPLRVIKGYIKKVDIKSIIEQEASIELKSNKVLR
jgi:hypothetical protein